MTNVTYDEVVKLAEQLSPDEQQALIKHLQSSPQPSNRQRRKKNPAETLRVFHVDTWPENMTLRREDEYGDDGR